MDVPDAPALHPPDGHWGCARVERIFKAKGPSGVLAEIGLIEGSWGKRVYFTELLKSPGLDAATVRQVLDQAGRQIDSDFELASLLISSDRLLTDDATRRAYFDAARSIQSDFEMRRALSAALKQGKLSPDMLVGVLDTSTSIDSDFEEAELLVQIAKLQPLDRKNPQRVSQGRCDGRQRLRAAQGPQRCRARRSEPGHACDDARSRR